jgi:hypothetical protein
MRVAVEGPTEHAGGVLTTLMQRRGAIIGAQESGGMTITEADVPLAEMFGCDHSPLATQGKADFTMEFSRYMPVPESIEAELVERRPRKRKRVRSMLKAQSRAGESNIRYWPGDRTTMLRKEVNEKSPLRFSRARPKGARPGKARCRDGAGGVGKTAFLVQIGLDEAMRERPVLHVALGRARTCARGTTPSSTTSQK